MEIFRMEEAVSYLAKSHGVPRRYYRLPYPGFPRAALPVTFK